MAVLGANLINMCFNLILNFVQPKFLSIDSYAAIKTFQLYCSYVGILHFGYVDGMYLYYGGKNLNEIDNNSIQKNISTLRFFEVIISLIFFVIGIFSRDFVIICFSISILPLNMVGYYRSLYQAVGEFDKYGRTMNINTIFIFIINIILIFLFKIDNYFIYIIMYTIINIIMWILLEWNFIKEITNVKANFKISVEELILNIKNGFLLMMGNFSSIILTSIDRWFIKFLLNSLSFAQYSFVVSIENFMNIAITPVSITLYNYFCNVKDIYKVKRIRNLVVIFSVFIVSAAFPAKFILENFLIEYIGATSVLFYLFASQIFYIIIKSFYVNLYKAKSMQNKYFFKLIIVIIVSVVFNIICFNIIKSKEAFAIGTLLSSILWFILCIPDFKQYKFKLKELIFIFFEITIFVLCGLYLETIIGFFIYIIGTLGFSWYIFKAEFNYIGKKIITKLKINNTVYKNR